MKFNINSFIGLQALINSNSAKKTYKAKVKFSDKEDLVSGTIVYGKGTEFIDTRGRVLPCVSEYTFSFDEKDEEGFTWSMVESYLFSENNKENFYIEYIEIEMEEFNEKG